VTLKPFGRRHGEVHEKANDPTLPEWQLCSLVDFPTLHVGECTQRIWKRSKQGRSRCGVSLQAGADERKQICSEQVDAELLVALAHFLHTTR